jgi:hypothetical protein
VARKVKVEQEDVWVARTIDELAVEVRKGWVQVAGLPDLVPLDEYYQRCEDNLQRLGQQEQALYAEIRETIKRALPLRTSQLQEEYRKLSWAYSAQEDQSHLRGLVKVCPLLGLLGPVESNVNAHHLSHAIRAFLATLLHLQPARTGNASNIVSRALSMENALQTRIITWEYLLSLRSTELVAKKERAQQKRTPLDQLLQQQQQILHELKEIKEMLCKQQASKHTAKEKGITT